jgi:hypothetical protein
MTDHRLRVLSGRSADAGEALRVLDETPIRIVIPPQPTLAQQIIALTLVDLLGRLFRRTDVQVDPDAVSGAGLPPGPPSLAARLELARGNGGLEPGPVDTRPFLVTVGRSQVRSNLFVDGSGWQSYIGTDPSGLREASPIPFGPLLAACRAAAHIFSAAFSGMQLSRPIPKSSYSTLVGYRTSELPIVTEDFPAAADINIVLVGAGSIGGAAIIGFAHMMTLKGTIVIVDPQLVEDRNLVKALLVRPPAVAERAAKVKLARFELEHHKHLTVVDRQMSIEDYHASLNREAALPLLLCAVDSSESRRSVQDCLPLELINAACHPQEITISRHITDQGPCVCCLHMADVLDTARNRARLIAGATGLEPMKVIDLWNSRAPLTDSQLRAIERHRADPVGALKSYEGRDLEGLWREQLLYAEVPLQVNTTRVSVATPFVTALAGFMLAAEAAKPAGIDPQQRLGPGARAIKYTESPFSSPEYALLSSPARWATSECLCRSSRRIRLMRQRYGLA